MLKNIVIPEPIIKAFEEIINNAPEHKVRVLASNHKELFRGGFRPESHVKFFKDKLKTMLKSFPKKENAWFLDFLRNLDLYQSFIIVLSKNAIEFGLDCFFSVYGKERFLANLLLDERDEIQQIAVDYMENTDWQKKALPNIEEAVETIKNNYRPFLEHIVPFLQDEIAVDVIKEKKILKQPTYQNETLKNELKKLEDSYEKLENKTKKLKSTIETLKNNLEKIKKDFDKITEENNSLKKKVESIQKENLSLNLSLNLKELETITVDNSFYRDELMRKADMLLSNSISKRSYPLDINTMSRLNLNRATDLIHSLYILHFENLENSLEFDELLNELSEQAYKIRKKLSIFDGYSPLFYLLIDRINEIATPDDLNDIYSELTRLDNYLILTDREIEMLYGLCCEKMDKFYCCYTPNDLAIFSETSNPLLYLRSAIKKGTPFLLVLDGYNITHTLKDIFYPYYEKGKPLEKARKRLLTLIERIAKRARELTIKVYFDSKNPEEMHQTDNVKVIFSGIPGKHSADERIIGDFTFDYTYENKTLPCFLVTDDKDLANQAYHFGVRTMSLREFKIFLDKID